MSRLRSLGLLTVACALLGGALLGGAPALAQQKAKAPATTTWTDPLKRVSFQYPRGWDVQIRAQEQTGFVAMIVGLANEECEVFVLNSPGTEGKPASLVAEAYAKKEMGRTEWTQMSNDLKMYGGKAVVEETSVKTDGLFPAFRATLRTDDGAAANGAMIPRPGVELWHFCRSFDGRDRSAKFEEIFASAAGVKDADFAAEIEAAKTAPPVAAEPPPKPEEPKAEDKKKKRAK